MNQSVTSDRLASVRRDRHLARNLRRGLVLGVCLGVAGGMLTIQTRLAQQTVTVRHLQDFGLFYAQAAQATIGQNPYGPVIRPGGRTPDNGANLNPPHFHLLVRPFTWVPAVPAYWSWIATSALALLGAFALTYRTLRVSITPEVALGTSAAIATVAPTTMMLITGQVAWLLTLPVTWAWVQAREGRWIRSAIVIGAAASVKPFLWLFLPYFLMQRRWRASLACVGAGVLLYAIGLAAFGTAAGFTYVDLLRKVWWARFPLNGSAYGWIDRMVQGSAHLPQLHPLPLAAHVPTPLASAIAAAAIALLTLWAIRSERTRRDVDRAFLGVLTAALLISPLGWSYYFWLFMGPLLALAICDKWWRPRTPAAAFAWLSVPGLLWPPGFLAMGQPSGWATATIGSAYFWALAAIWGACVWTPRSPVDRVQVDLGAAK